jgi:hypothetical protein
LIFSLYLPVTTFAPEKIVAIWLLSVESSSS